LIGESQVVDTERHRDSDQLIRFGKWFATCNLVILLTVAPTRANRHGMHNVASLVETYLAAERNLVATSNRPAALHPFPTVAPSPWVALSLMLSWASVVSGRG
jgi:hypothetical protein